MSYLRSTCGQANGIDVWRMDIARNVLILVNPFGGTKKARRICRTIVEPMFKLANVQYEVIGEQKQIENRTK